MPSVFAKEGSRNPWWGADFAAKEGAAYPFSTARLATLGNDGNH